MVLNPSVREDAVRNPNVREDVVLNPNMRDDVVLYPTFAIADLRYSGPVPLKLPHDSA